MYPCFFICSHLKYFSVRLRQCWGFDLGFCFYLFLGFSFSIVLDHSMKARLSCFKTPKPLLFSHPPRFVAFIKLSVTSQMWYANRLRQAGAGRNLSTVHESRFCCPTDTVMSGCQSLFALKNCRLRVLCVYFGCPEVTLCPRKPCSGLSGPSVASERRVLPLPFLRRETKS